MFQRHKTWMAAMAFALSATSAVAISTPDGTDAVAGGPDASALMAFYGVSLSTSPAGVAEDKAVWLAKVQGLIAQAPPLFQQSTLASKTKAEFAANLAILEQMQKGTLESSANAVKSLGANGKLQAKGVVDPNLGSFGPIDLVYTPLAPCRIMDTRNASGASGVQGPLAGNTLYHIPGFITTGQNWGQYDQLAPLSDCGLNTSVGSDLWAIAIVITILNPNFDAYLGVSDANNLSTVLSKVALNFTHGQGLSTMYITPLVLNTSVYFAMPAGLSANLIFDVVGYFATSRATPLECVIAELQGTGTANVANNTTTGFSARAACPSGYTTSSISCTYGAIAPAGLALIQVGPANTTGGTLSWGSCIWRNQSGATLNASDFYTISNCCRLPGR